MSSLFKKKKIASLAVSALLMTTGQSFAGAVEDQEFVSQPMLEFERGVELSEAAVVDLLSSLEPRAIEIASTRLGPVWVENSALIRLPISRAAVGSFKLMNASGLVVGIMLDAYGQEITEEIYEAELDEATRKAGPIHPTLAAAMQAAKPDEKLPVLVWFKVPDRRPAAERPDPNADLGMIEADAMLAAIEAGQTAKLEGATRTLRDRVGEMGVGAALESIEGFPILVGELSTLEIEALAGLADIIDISLNELCEPNGDLQRRVVKADIVNARGIRGTAVKTAVVEVGGRANPSHPYLTLAHQNTTYSYLNYHADAVAGIINSGHPEVQGIAINAPIWLGGGSSSSHLMNRTSAARAWGARVFNNSWGNVGSSSVPNAQCRFFDALALDYWRTIVFSAGNHGADPPRNPANLYNGIVVGASFDKHTLSTSDDVMAAFSAWRDPSSANGDRELPQVVAPGERIKSLRDQAPWLWTPGLNGTSLSAPAVSAVASLLIDRRTILSVWPEVIRAVLMATAITNIEGNTRLSDKDGAGQIRADLADDVVRGARGDIGGVGYTCSAPQLAVVGNMSLQANKRVRVSMSWATDPDYGHYTTRPGADLDLQIVAPNGQVVATSSSWDNTFEIVDFTPAASGTYAIRVHKYRCSFNPGYLGWAWWQAP